MSNVQEALKAAIEAMENEDDLKPIPFGIRCIRAINKCKAALSEIEKCEQYIEIRTGLFAHIKWLRVNDLPDGAKLYTSPQSRDWERLLDEAIPNALSCEYQTTLHSEQIKYFNAGVSALYDAIKQLKTKY